MRRLAVALAAAAAVAYAGAILFEALSWSAILPDFWGFRGYAVFVGLAYLVVGAVVAVRRPEHRIGWIMLATGLLYGVDELGLQYAIFAVVGRDVPLPAGVFAAWLGSWLWGPIVALLTPALLLLFPDGRMPFGRIAPLIWAIAILSAGSLVVDMAFRPGPLQLATYQENPFTLLAPGESFVGNAAVALSVPTSLFVVLGVIRRFRRARGIERAQLKWLAAAIVPYALTGLLSIGTEKVWQYAYIVMQAWVSVAIGVAVLRYRLYDIDLLINRTLVYGALSAALVASFSAFIFLLQIALRPFTSGSELAVAASTLATLALVQPLRRRIQDAVDRRFYRRRHDSARLLDALGARLREEVDLDSVCADLVAAAGRAVEPVHTSVWIRPT